MTNQITDEQELVPTEHDEYENDKVASPNAKRQTPNA